MNTVLLEQELDDLLSLIARGTHDPTPTRMLPHVDNAAAWAVDEFWQRYYASNDAQNKSIARRCIQLRKIINDCN